MELPAIGVEEWLNTWERSATTDIAQSTISALSMGELLSLDGRGGETLRDRLDSERMSYGWIEGSPDFKRQVASLYKSDVDPSRILQTNGATGANLNALMTIVEPGDHVIAEWPTYSPLYELPRSLGARVDLWHMRRSRNWVPDIEELKCLVRPDTKLICINNASNPTGTVLSSDLLHQIAEVAASVGAYVLSDEVYLPLEDTWNFESMVDVYDRAVVTNSVSKTYSVPGARIGWTVSNRELADRMRVCRDYTMISGGVLNDAIATYVLANREVILRRNRAIVLGNLGIAREWVDAQPRVSWVAPQSVPTSYVLLDIPMGDEEFCRRLLSERGVLLVPGSRFGLPCGARLGYCTSPEVLRRGLALLGDALACV